MLFSLTHVLKVEFTSEKERGEKDGEKREEGDAAEAMIELKAVSEIEAVPE